MYGNKMKKSIILALLLAGVIQAGMTAYSTASGRTAGTYTGDTAYAAAQNAAAPDTAVQEVEIPKKEIDIDRITLKKEAEDTIISLDGVNADRNITNYKTLLAALDVPSSFQVQIEDMYNNGHRVPEVLTAYDYLYQNYGSIYELEGLVLKRESGTAWKDIFKEYNAKVPEFVPNSFPGGELEKIFKTPGITVDDVIIADRISQLTGRQFDELIEMRGQGKDWKTINESLGMVNTSGELPRVAVTSAQVKKHMAETGLSEEQIIEALVLAQKIDRDGKSIIDKLRSGIEEEAIIAESLEDKYQ